MHRTDERSGAFFSCVDLEARVPPAHPLRAIREIVNAALAEPGADLRRYMRRWSARRSRRRSCCGPGC